VKGFGLGLYYVKEMVEGHKGKVELKSKLGEGSEFRLFFPQVKKI
jgi:two-component system phosphate regulon sensor histidine kinase PhoR